jgi:hypothetical protein
MARVVFHRDVAQRLRLGIAEGQAELGRRILETAYPNVPVRTGALRESGSFAVTVDGELVAGDAEVPSREPGVAVFVGYAWPARALELGTIYVTPRPWLTPAIVERSADAAPLMADGANLAVKT